MFVYAYYNFFKGGLSDKDKVTGYAKEHNHNILSSFSDNGIYTRDGICRLLKRLQTSRTRKILVYSLDHLWSDEDLHYLLVFRLKKLGAEIISITEPSYSVSNDDIIKKGSSISNYIKALLPSISTAKMAQKREDKGLQGQKPCGVAPLGYIWDNDGNIIENKGEAKTVKIIFEKYLDLRSLSKLAEYINSKGIITRKNNTFSRAALQSILRNDFYIGISTYQGIKTEGTHTPLIDKDLFDKVGQVLLNNAKCTKK